MIKKIQSYMKKKLSLIIQNANMLKKNFNIGL